MEAHMKCPPALQSEEERLRALADHGLDDEQGLASLDPVVRIAARMFGMPVAAVNMIGSDHVFFAASVGVGEVDMGRDVSFCAHAIAQDGVMVVPDALLDERFHDNPLVTGPANLRFYAGVPLLSPEGHPMGALCVIDGRPHEDFSVEDQERLRELARMASDRLELRRIEVSAERSRPSFDEYAGSSTTPVVWFDEQRRIVALNTSAAALHGYHPAECVGQPLELLLGEQAQPAVQGGIARAVEAGSLQGLDIPTEVQGRRKDGTLFMLGLSLFCWRHQGRLRFEAVLKDLTAQRLVEDELRLRASSDPLTGLANRACFYRRVQDALLAPQAAAVLMLDLDGFKDVNDTLGHAVGDGLLQEVAQRLAHIAGHGLFEAQQDLGPLAARLGGDEFALLLPGVGDADAANLFAQRVIEAIHQPISISGHAVRVGASCGISVAPRQAHEALELVGNADLALFQAKTLGRGRSFVFVPALRMEAVARRLYGMELNRAVDQGELVLFYQPQVHLRDGSLSGAEALIRWRHPQRGLLAPAAFLPALEGGPLAARVGSWILDEACAQAAFWRRHGAPALRMGVNLFGVQFRVGDLATEVMDALARHGLPPDALELEITENIVLDHDDVVPDMLRRLRAHGVGISFDDFGTGYASLSLLTTYPLTRIKIDRAFVNGMLESRREASVVRAILDMARSFDLQTIAEGVETEAQRERLCRERCDEGQGYLFAKPMPAQQFGAAYGLLPPLRGRSAA
jgi:diguanylate cyclase (GGDEF)-like protein/PAS domain S-box-containing protein